MPIPAPIWSMRPLSNSLIDDVPLRLLAPHARKLWPMEDDGASNPGIFSTDAGYYRGRQQSSDTRPSGLWYHHRPNFDNYERKVGDLLSKKHIFRNNSLMFFSGEVYRALREVDLGVGQFTRMPIYRADLETEFDVEFYLLEYSNFKDTVDRENTPRCRPLYRARPEAGYLLASSLEGKDVFVHRAAKAGPELWFDPMIGHVQFVSDRVAQHLLGLGLRDEFILNQCKFLNA